MNTKLKLSIIGGLVAVVLALFSIFIWWLLTSVSIANAHSAIQARHFYYFNLAPKVGLNLKELPFDIIAMQSMNDQDGITYAYIMLGRYKNIDPDNQIIYLITKTNQTFGFKYASDSKDELVFQEKESGVVKEKTFSENPFGTRDVLSIQWVDKRILEQILSDAMRVSNNLIIPNMGIPNFQRINRL